MAIYNFNATIEKIGINPFVFVPENILQKIFKDSGKNKGAIPVCGSINGKQFRQTLVRYSGDRRLYINSSMLPMSPERVGEKIKIELGFDAEIRIEKMHPALKAALQKEPGAQKVYYALNASTQKEILRYINQLKTTAALEKNISKAIGFLLGKEGFIGRNTG